MRSSFSDGAVLRTLRAISAILLGMALFSSQSCAPKRESERRAFLPAVEEARFGSITPPSKSEGWDRFMEGDEAVSACAWLKSLGDPRDPVSRFRMLGRAEVNLRAIANPPPGGSTALASNPNVPVLLDVNANVDVDGSPLYSFAILSQAIPGRNEFLNLVDQEIERMGGNPLLRFAYWLMKSGVINPLSQRNGIVQERINAALPGAFSSDDWRFKVDDSIPWILFKNGNPELGRNILGPSDGSQDRERKKEVFAQVVANYAQALPLFPEASWIRFETDFKEGLAAAVRAVNSKELSEKSCATVIMHRTLAQLLTIAGFDRLPSAPRAQGNSSFFADFSSILDSPEGNTFVVCRSPGSFAFQGRRKVMGRDELTDLSSMKEYFELSKEPLSPRECRREEAVTFGGEKYGNYQGPTVSRFGGATEWLSLIDAMAHFSYAFNPGAKWWKDPDNTTGYPLSPFESLDRIKSSGAVLPAEAHALALGMLNLGMKTLQGRHLVFLDRDRKEIQDSSKAAGLRVSESPRTFGNREPVVTSVRAASLLVELAFEFSSSLRALSVWKQGAEGALKEEAARETNPRKRASLFMDYRNFVEGLFGAEKTLSELTDEGADSARAQLASLKLGAAFMASAFARRNPDGTFGCHDHLELDVAAGVEAASGQCSDEDGRLWKRVMRIVAREYRSPVFAELGQ